MKENVHALLITGGARRMGATMAVTLARHGYDIALHYHHSADQAQAIQAQIAAMGSRCELICADLAQSGAATEVVEQAYSAMPHLHGVVNNASVFIEGTLLETDEALFEQQFNINLRAPFFITQAFARRVGRGVVINLLDTFITKSSTSYFTYLLTKKSLADLTRMAARDLGPNIRVNAVAPGVILPLGKFDEAYMQQKCQQLPLQRNATVEEVCAAVHALIITDYLTGQIVYVDSGEHLR